MKSIDVAFLIGLIFFLISACGYRTAPIPYDTPELTLPVVQVSKPIYRGDQLVVGWKLDTTSPDQSADIFNLSVFEQKATCLSCSLKPFSIITVNSGIENSIRVNGTQIQNAMVRYLTADTSHQLYIDKMLIENWNTRGLYYLTINYITKDGTVSAHSVKVRPTKATFIPEPKIKIIKNTYSNDPQMQTIVFQWDLIPEFVYRTILQKKVSAEKIKHFGLNLYRVTRFEGRVEETKVNDQPLESGQISIIVENFRLSACHVDRFGNESKQVTIIDSMYDQNKEEGKL
jgi:hypothetical protein